MKYFQFQSLLTHHQNIFFGISIIFSVKSIYLGSLKKNVINNFSNNLNYRSSILDRNGNILAKTVFTTNVGLNPNLVIDKKRLLLNLRLIFQDKSIEDFKTIEKKLNRKKFFYIKKKNYSRSTKSSTLIR